MDPFDEFEFKPLTEGLGFHKKKSENKTDKSEAKSKRSTDSILRDKGFSLLDEETTTHSHSNTLTPPLPRKSRHKIENFTENIHETKSTPTAVDDILKNLQKNRHFDIENTTASLKNTKVSEEFKPTTWNFSSTFLDSMLVLAASLLCMIILLMITHVDLVANLTNPDQGGMIYLATASLFFTVTFIYMLINRAFLGCTPGEWAFDQRIGKPEEMQNATYALRVAARTLLVMFTGFIVFPIASLITGKDVAGSITGAPLYKKV